ncbi:MAG: rhomboid family intramembrane serine protease [Spirochaetales bacterium]|nr:rhomboid family intramembrane serine protease [Spirochaetales bacterium]
MAYAPVTRLLLILNVAIFAGQVLLFQPGSEYYLRRLSLVPAEFWAGQGSWQPLTSMFLHGSFMHILFNMIALYSLGIPIERTLGSGRFSWLYFVSGFTSAIAILLFQFDSTDGTVGASGAIFGLLGALAVFYPDSMLLVFFFPMRARTAALLMFIASVILTVFDIFPGISHLGHAGGLVGGILYSRLALGMATGQKLEAGPAGFGGSVLRTREERLREHLRTMFEEPSGPRTIVNPATGREEKIINPSREDLAEQSVQKRLYFDPATGRFFFK